MKPSVTHAQILEAEKLADKENDKALLECISCRLVDDCGDSVIEPRNAVAWQIEIVDYDNKHDFYTLHAILKKAGVTLPADMPWGFIETPTTTAYEYAEYFDGPLFYSGDRYPEEKDVRSMLYRINLPLHP